MKKIFYIVLCNLFAILGSKIATAQTVSCCPVLSNVTIQHLSGNNYQVSYAYHTTTPGHGSVAITAGCPTACSTLVCHRTTVADSFWVINVVSVSGVPAVYSYSTDNCGGTPCPQGPLPVNFISFNVQNLKTEIKLSWTVGGANNVPGDRFAVNRSVDGVNFSQIAAIPVGAGLNYSYDDSPAPGNIFYEVCTLFNCTPVKKVELSEDNTVKYYYNGSQLVTRYLPAGAITLVVDGSGRTVAKSSFISISVRPGLYFLETVDKNGKKIYSDKILAR